MKFLYILCLSMVFHSCGSAKETTTMITGTYQISSIKDYSDIPSQLTIEFNNEKKTVSGFSGCNRFTGNYEISDHNLNLGPLATTRKLCAGSGQKVEDLLLKLLDQVKTFEFKNDTLLLKDQDDTILITAKQTVASEAEKSLKTNPYTVEYSAISRGSFLKITLKDQTVTVQKNRDELPLNKELNLEQMSSILDKLNKLNLSKLEDLEAPSKKHQFDGAPIASFKITKNGETYQTRAFDHGNPPEEIADLVNEMLSFVEKP